MWRVAMNFVALLCKTLQEAIRFFCLSTWHTHTYTHAHTHTHTHIHIHIHTRTHTHIHTHTCTCTRTRTHTYTQTHTNNTQHTFVSSPNCRKSYGTSTPITANVNDAPWDSVCGFANTTVGDAVQWFVIDVQPMRVYLSTGEEWEFVAMTAQTTTGAQVCRLSSTAAIKISYFLHSQEFMKRDGYCNLCTQTHAHNAYTIQAQHRHNTDTTQHRHNTDTTQAQHKLGMY